MTTILPGKGVHFRVWAPRRKEIQVVLGDRSFPLDSEAGGYFSAIIEHAKAGSRYRFRLDDDEYLYPDPESRFQPDGPHGDSEVVDPDSFSWTDENWKGVTPEGQVIYEMHIGTFTEKGTWAAAGEHLKELAAIGISVLETMPVAEFTGRWGWGYDGVDLFAPSHLYGSPDDLRRFIDKAHGLGLGLILDVVYNHFGPDGNYAAQFATDYFTDKYKNDWGESINFGSQPVRDFYERNAAYWIREFHFDGLRLDATQDIHDSRRKHIIAEITKTARAAAGKRSVYIVAENEPQDSWMVHSVGTGGFGIDALWNDDFHHSALVALTGRNEAYYTDYLGSPQEFLSAAKYGCLYQGQRYKWQKKRRGSPAFGLEPWNFVAYIQNHDQVANSGRGSRPNLLTDPASYRAMSALLLLGPATPMLLQGQEFGATTPFLFFCDHSGELCNLIHTGRKEFLAQFRSIAQPEMQKELPDPGDPKSFEASKLKRSEANPQISALYTDLLQLRRHDPVLRRPKRLGMDGAVLSSHAFLLRYFDSSNGDRLLMMNLGTDLHLDPAPEPLLAPPAGASWSVLWSSEDPKYGGTGTYPPDSDDNWRLPARSVILLAPKSGREAKS